MNSDDADEIKSNFFCRCSLPTIVSHLIEILDKIFRKLPSLTKISNPKMLAMRNQEIKLEKQWRGRRGGHIDFSSISYCLKRFQGAGGEGRAGLGCLASRKQSWNEATTPKQTKAAGNGSAAGVATIVSLVPVCVCMCVCVRHNWDAGEAALTMSSKRQGNAKNKKKIK